MSHNPNEAEREMEKAIFISADCWLSVFDLLEPSQLGLGIALISHRFDFYVDEHFKTRKWALKFIRIWPEIGENGTKNMEIVKHYDGKPMPIPQILLPRKVIGFKCIDICFINQNVIAFLRRFRRVFVSSPLNLAIYAYTDRILEFIWRKIWPMIARNICGMELFANVFHRLRKFVPSILDECPSLRFVFSSENLLFPQFPADDNAMALDGQVVAKWLFTPHPNNVPKVLKCCWDMDDVASKVEAFKAAFSKASSPVNFIVYIRFPWPLPHTVVPFELTNELTREQLALKRINNSDRFLLIRCPIARNENKWTKWEKEAIDWHIRDQWNQMHINIYHGNGIGDGLLNATPGLSDQQQK